MKKLLLTIALFAGITTATYAQGEVNVLYLDGTPHVIAMTDIDKIELSKDWWSKRIYRHQQD